MLIICFFHPIPNGTLNLVLLQGLTDIFRMSVYRVRFETGILPFPAYAATLVPDLTETGCFSPMLLTYFTRLFICKNIDEFKLQHHLTTLTNGRETVMGGDSGC